MREIFIISVFNIKQIFRFVSNDTFKLLFTGSSVLIVPKKVIMTPMFVIPAKAGIHYFRHLQVPGFPLSRE